MDSSVASMVETGIDRLYDETKDVYSDIMTEMNGVGNGIEKIVHDLKGLADEMTNNVKHIIESFVVSLPFVQVSKPGSEDGNLGNNVHLLSPFPNSAPYRFGLHIKRDDLGYRIARIFEDTIAHHAKLREDDILTHLNDIDLGPKNIVKVIALFSSVGNPFSLTILRELESGERTEIVIEINIKSEEVGQSIEIQVTVRGSRYIPDSQDPMTPIYITQDPDGESQQYINIASNGTLIMAYDPVPFVFQKYFTIYSTGSLPSILKTLNGSRAFDFTQQKMMPFNSRRIENYMLKATAGNDGLFVLEQLYRQGNDDDRNFLNNTNNEIVVSTFDRLETVPMSGRFFLPTADAATTSTTHRGRSNVNGVN